MKSIRIILTVLVCFLILNFTTTKRQTKVEIKHGAHDIKDCIIKNSTNGWRLIDSVFLGTGSSIDIGAVLTFEK